MVRAQELNAKCLLAEGKEIPITTREALEKQREEKKHLQRSTGALALDYPESEDNATGDGGSDDGWSGDDVSDAAASGDGSSFDFKLNKSEDSAESGVDASAEKESSHDFDVVVSDLQDNTPHTLHESASEEVEIHQVPLIGEPLESVEIRGVYAIFHAADTDRNRLHCI
ncbi:hypothetical protein GN244_ATG16420 [Phytophthora infestans]|uniref:Uncharacterized protein n=1 Tax=Phytophthora infestans TaxID=4787 RepID=A0A833SAS8_PHYIN|nr:hypothetical protein GN244_ATG16420 [Phytophthora infestans]